MLGTRLVIVFVGDLPAYLLGFFGSVFFSFCQILFEYLVYEGAGDYCGIFVLSSVVKLKKA